MFLKDQEVRQKLTSENYNPDAKELWANLSETDSINQIQLKEILHVYGWIPKSKIGEKASDGIFYIVQHSGIELMEKYFPELKKLSQMGEASKTHCAMMEDRILLFKGLKQKYGTQAFSDSNRKIKVWPIENTDSVNILRKEMDFELTVEENAIRLNAEYDKDEMLPEKQ
jgi:hypothetical protein